MLTGQTVSQCIPICNGHTDSDERTVFTIQQFSEGNKKQNIIWRFQEMQIEINGTKKLPGTLKLGALKYFSSYSKTSTQEKKSQSPIRRA